MRAHPSILIVDGNEHAAAIMEFRLSPLGVTCVREFTSTSAIARARNEVFDLIVLSPDIEDMSYMEIRRELKRERATATIPILLTLGGTISSPPAEWLDLEGDTLLHRDHFDQYLLPRVRFLLDQNRQRLYPFPPDNVTLSVVYHERRPSVLRAAGSIFQLRIPEGETKLPEEVSNFDLMEEFSDPFRPGVRIFEALRAQNDYKRMYDAVTNKRAPENVRLRFAGPTDLIRIPFEWAVDPANPFEKWRSLGLKHAVSRMVTGCDTRREPISATFLSRLHARREQLEILLICLDESFKYMKMEVEQLISDLPRVFGGQGLVAKAELVPYGDTTYKKLGDHIRGSKHHIIHFAAHGLRGDRPSKNTLPLHPASGEPSALTGSDLADMLRDSQARFVYLGCCHAAENDAPGQAASPFGGIIDAVVHAGIPAALAFLLPPRDKDAAEFARQFYQQLAKVGDLDIALLRTRRHFSANLGDERWAAPVLVLQH